MSFAGAVPNLDFIDKLNRFRPRFGEQYMLPFDYEPEKDDGKGCDEAAN
jgi:hypothetical protein